MTDGTLDKAYAECLALASSHYENFPTASHLLARPQRKATAAIYSFARRADDFADEGDLQKEERLALLNQFSSYLVQIEHGQIPDDLSFAALADVINNYQLPVSVLERLLTAFRMDVGKKRYTSFEELMNYCHHSADPVGELVLRIHRLATPSRIELSNLVCSALQLINFIQDIDEDYQQRNRIYIPMDEMKQYNVDESQLADRHQTRGLQQLVSLQLARAKSMLIAGAPLINNVPGRLHWILKITILAALRIIEKLEGRTNIYDRPILTKREGMIWLPRRIPNPNAW